MSNLAIFPYVATEQGWSLSDSVMAAIWMQIEQEGKVEHLFYDGSLRDIQGWLEFIKQPRIFLIVVADMDKKKPVHVAWLTDVADGIAWSHHCSIGRYCRGVWEAVRDYWAQSPIRILLGLTPESNEMAVKFLKRICHFEIVGIIPTICNMVYDGERVGGVLSYHLLNGTPE